MPQEMAKISESDVFGDDDSIIALDLPDSTEYSDVSEDADESILITDDDDVSGSNPEVGDGGETSDCSDTSGDVISTSDSIRSSDYNSCQSSCSSDDSSEMDESGVGNGSDDFRPDKKMKEDCTDSSDTSLILSDDSECITIDDSEEDSDDLEDESENSEEESDECDSEDSDECDSEDSENESDESTSDDDYGLYGNRYSPEGETDREDSVDSSSSDSEESDKENIDGNTRKYTIKRYNIEILKISVDPKKSRRITLQKRSITLFLKNQR